MLVHIRFCCQRSYDKILFLELFDVVGAGRRLELSLKRSWTCSIIPFSVTKPREIRPLAWGHPAGKWKSQVQAQACLTSKAVVFVHHFSPSAGPAHLPLRSMRCMITALLSTQVSLYPLPASELAPAFSWVLLLFLFGTTIALESSAPSGLGGWIFLQRPWDSATLVT